MLSVDASASKSKDKGTDILTTHTPTQIIGINSVTISTGKDLNMVGAQVSGNTVTADVGGNLSIESQQDTHTYHSKGSSSGFGITAPIGAGTISVSASASKNSMDSDYASVTNQSGIFAGTGGFQISVERNTDLTGAVIDSTADANKNNLTTGALTMEDIQNQADYDSKNAGVSYTYYGSDADKKEHYNQTGLTPNLTPGPEGSASTTTHAAIAQGTITTTKEQTDLSKINRDTANALNQLGKLFDRKTVEEKQELSKLFGQEAFNAVGDYAASRQKNAKTLEEWEAWEDGGKNKVLLHQLVGGLMGAISGGAYQSGALSAGLNEAMQGLLKDIKDPAAHQWVSAIVGAAANAVTGGNAWTGAAIAQSGTKWNYLTHEEADAFTKEFAACNGDKAKERKVFEKYKAMDDAKASPHSSDLNYNWTGFHPTEDGGYSTEVVTKPVVVPKEKDTSHHTPPDKIASTSKNDSNLNQPDFKPVPSGVTNGGTTTGDTESKKNDFNWKNSAIQNSIVEQTNTVPDRLVKLNVGGKGLRYFVKAGGIAGIGLTLNDMRDDYHNYSGGRLWMAWGADVIPIGAGIIGGGVGGVPGSIIIGTLGDYAKNKLKEEYIFTDKDAQKKHELKEKNK
ncbi:hemagglutinin repeat-containing protein [Megasphaera cerevisiae]|uniref:hemagglutinin repeat-containing protein n=1 Tax=Megasphaera cerevisiae TaxID=39029 RepID=UPI0009427116|nr:hemagglutinin repeat-containing protein [Megasphaera cerevisiae]OKY52983.1 hypothetical protein BSR42_09875 [Megasphaera cerevisiae]